MSSKPTSTILLLGSYGNAGTAIAESLLRETTGSDILLILAGRDLERVQAQAEKLRKSFDRDQLRAMQVDASWPVARLKAAFELVDLLVVASSTSALEANVLDAALQANVHYFDLQLHCQRESNFSERKSQIEKSGKYFITEGGYHPGVPSALFRYIADKEKAVHRCLVSANFYLFVQPNWESMTFSDSTKKEFLQEVTAMDNRVYKDDVWEKQGWTVQRDFDFGGEIKTQTCVPIYLNELGDIPIPTLSNSLKEMGVYIAGFNLVTIFFVMPLCMLALWVFPKRALQPMSNLFFWSLQKFTSPPYGTVLALEAETCADCDKGSIVIVQVNEKPETYHWSIRISHPDAYVMTAIPAVACILQLLDACFTTSTDQTQPFGLYRQGAFVEPQRFLSDMKRMGLEVTIIFKSNAFINLTSRDLPQR